MTPPNFDAAFDFTGKAALVTGGAAGIGAAIARALAARGARVAIVDVSAAAADTTGALPGVGHVSHIADLTKSGASEQAVQAAVAAMGRLDILVNNAGIVLLERAEAVSDADWDRTMAINLRPVHDGPRRFPGVASGGCWAGRQSCLASRLRRP